MLHKGKVEQPKEKTLEFYKVAKDKGNSLPLPDKA